MEMDRRKASCLYDYKIQKDFDGKDMESDLIQLYEDIRKMMARMFQGEDFGPEATAIIPSEISESERALFQRDIVIEKKEIKVGCNQIKYRVKQLRQNFKKAVGDETRSGSGRFIIENWDHLVSIWGGCPSVNQIKGAVVSSPDDEIMDSRMDRDIDSSEQEMESNVQPEIDEFNLTAEEESTCQRKRKKTKKNVVDEPKKIKVSENKRRKLEKPLSAQQRDQVMVKVAKEELELKKKKMSHGSSTVTIACHTWRIDFDTVESIAHHS